MKLRVEQLPCSLPEFHAKLLAYMLDRVAHRLKENTPAPFPEFELLRAVAEKIEAGESFEVEFDPPLAPDQTATIAALAKKEYDAECFRDEVNKEIQKLRVADGKSAVPNDEIKTVRSFSYLDLIA